MAGDRQALSAQLIGSGTAGMFRSGVRVSRAFDTARRSDGCVCQKPDPSVMPRWNRLSCPNDRVVLLRSGRLGLAIQVEVTA